MDPYVSREEHDEFCRRMDDEKRRQNKRIDLLEENTRRMEILNTSIEKLALNMENMLKEQLQQGERLEVLEGRDGDMWRSVVGYAITTIVGIIIGLLFKKVGM